MGRNRLHRTKRLYTIDNDLLPLLSEVNASELINTLLRKHFKLDSQSEYVYSEDEETYMRMQNVKGKIRWALVNNKYGEEAEQMLGCTIAQARAHIERQFTDEMSWDNYGEWHLDHVMPLSLHDLGVPENWKNAFSVRNYQPMWKDVNMGMSDKVKTPLSVSRASLSKV